MTKPTHRQLRDLAAVVLVALAMRAYVMCVMGVVSKDALWFVTGAQAIADGDYRAWLGHDQHPLTGACVWLAGVASGDWIRGGRIFNVVVGALTAAPVYFLGRALFGHLAGLCAAWFLAFHAHAARYSADVLSEPLYVFLFLSAILFGMLGVVEDKKRWLALCGVASALAYLTRPEGVMSVLVPGAWLCCQHIGDLCSDWKRRFARIGVLSLAFMALAAPYMIYVGGLSRKKSATEIIKFTRVRPANAAATPPAPQSKTADGDETATQEAVRHYLRSGYSLLGKLVSACTHTLMPLMVLGLICRRRGPALKRGELFLGSVVVLYLLLLFGVRTSAGYISRRHAFPIAMILMTWSGAGALAAAHWLTRIRRLRGRRTAALRWITGVMAVVLTARTAEPQNTRNLGEAKAGLWIRRHCATPPKVITHKLPRVACYAFSRNFELHQAFVGTNTDGRRVRKPERVSYWGILDHACLIEATHVVVEENQMYELAPAFIAEAKQADAAGAVPRLALRVRFKPSWRDASPTIFVYQVVTRPEGPTDEP